MAGRAGQTTPPINQDAPSAATPARAARGVAGDRGSSAHLHSGPADWRTAPADDATRAEAVLAGRPGVLHVQAHLDRGTATVTYHQHQTTAVTLWNWLAASRAGRGPRTPDHSEAEPDARAGAGR